jgi:hypothetical protein
MRFAHLLSQDLFSSLKCADRGLQGSFTPENSTSLMPSDIAGEKQKKKLSLFAIDKDLFFT